VRSATSFVNCRHLFLRVEQHRTVHLPRQADATKRVQGLRVACRKLVHRRFECRPPGSRVLLRPERLRARNAERRACRGDDAMLLRQQQQLELRRAEIDAEEHGGFRTAARACAA
jgi:hypothetical protein